MTGPGLRILMTSFYMPSESKIGVGHQVHLLANQLVALGHEVTVATPCVASVGATYTTLTLPVAGPARTFRWALRLRRLDLSGYDVLHAHGDDYWLWRRRVRAHVRTMHGSCLAEALRVPSGREKLRMVLLGLGELLATAVADRTVAVSANTTRWMPWVRQVIPNGVDAAALRGERTPSPHPSILFVGTYENRKRGRLLAEAFARDVLPARPDAELWMVCSDAPPAPQVTVLGRVESPELVRLYRSAWAFCLPSSYEGFGIPYVEALTAGLPVVATRNPGATELAAQCPMISLVPDDGLGAALLGALQDGPPDDMAVAAARASAEPYDIEKVALAYVAVYRELLERHP